MGMGIEKQILITKWFSRSSGCMDRWMIEWMDGWMDGCTILPVLLPEEIKAGVGRS